MLGRERTHLILTVAALSVGALALIRLGPSHGSSEVVGSAHGRHLPAPAGLDAVSAIDTESGASHAERVALSSAEPEPPSKPPRAVQDDPSHGTIAGTVYDDTGRPMANNKVIFTRSSSPSFTSKRFRATTNADGQYAVDGVPVGNWMAWSGPTSGTQSASPDEVLVPAGRLEVFEGSNYHDICVFGRKLSGRFTIEDKAVDGMTLKLELRDKLDPTQTVLASAQVWSSKRAPWRARSRPASPAVKPAEGAEPDVEAREYILRISPSAGVSAGGEELPLYVEVPVDLIDFDVALAPRAFTLDEFIGVALQRRSQGG